MSISQNIDEVVQKVGEEKVASGDGSSATALRLHNLAVAAILSGSRRPDGTVPQEWETYMREFAKTPEELAHLVPTDGTHTDAVKQEARAYLVAGGTCGPGTVMGIKTPITNKLDVA